MRKGLHTTIGALGATLLILVAASGCRRPPGVDREGAGAGPTAGEAGGGSGESIPSEPFGREPSLTEDSLSQDDGTGLGAAGLDAASLGLEIVYFEFNRSALTASTIATLDRNAEILKRNARVRVRIEGHCDERGTVEYNLALGDRRAAAVRDHLVARGVDRARLETVSFGEERPQDGSGNEAAWARNRRAEFHAF